MTCGVYAIKNRENGKLYIGSSSDIEARWAVHKSGLKKGNASKHLQRAWNVYGKDAFEFVILEETSKEETRQKEAEWFEKYHWEQLYNLSRKTTGGRGELSEEAKLQIAKATSERTKGKSLSAEHKAKIGAAHKGRKLDQRRKDLVSQQKKGKKLTKEHRAKISQSLIGNQRAKGQVPWNKKEKDNV